MSDIKEEQKRLYKRAEENDIKLLQEENKRLNRSKHRPKNRREEAIALRKECLEKGISLRDVMKERRAKRLFDKN